MRRRSRFRSYSDYSDYSDAFACLGLISDRRRLTSTVVVSVLQLTKGTQLAVDTSMQDPSPFVKWAGGKGSLLQHLLPNVPLRLTNYYEPFLGGGALFLGVCARNTHFHARLSDINNELINSYKVVKEAPEELIRLLSKFQTEYETSGNKSEYYYNKRDWRPTDLVESAARLIFLNKTCYNGLYRVNSRGEFNVPFGRYKRPRILNAEDIRAVSNVLRETKTELRTVDYKSALSACTKRDFVYLDPPYQPKSKTSSFTGYAPGGFSENDQEELAGEFARLVDRGCTVLLSNSDTSLTRRLYEEYEKQRVEVNRPISCVGSGRTGYSELIVLGAPR